MTSASEGGGGSWKSGRSKGDCKNFIRIAVLHVDEGGSENKHKSSRRHIWKLPLSKHGRKREREGAEMKKLSARGGGEKSRIGERAKSLSSRATVARRPAEREKRLAEITLSLPL